jgi:hypothetical protein
MSTISVGTLATSAMLNFIEATNWEAMMKKNLVTLTIMVPPKFKEELRELRAQIKPFPPTVTAMVRHGLELMMDDYRKRYLKRRKKAA